MEPPLIVVSKKFYEELIKSGYGCPEYIKPYEDEDTDSDFFSVKR